MGERVEHVRNADDPRGPRDLYFPLPKTPFVKAAAVADEAGGVSLFLLNRDLADGVTVTVDARGFGALKAVEAHELRHDDLRAINTAANPDKVSPVPLSGVAMDGGKVRLDLKRASWNVVKLAPA